MEYKRLTDKEWKLWYDEEFYTSACEPSDIEIHEIYGRLAELEDKIEDGTLVFRKKPKKKYYALILRANCYGKFVWHIDYAYIEYKKNGGNRVVFNIDGRLFSTTKDLVFNTKAEAEQRLKEVKDER